MKQLLLVLTLLSGASAVHAQSHKTIPIFWQITKAGTKDTSYLLGTYHLASADRIAKLKPVQKAFDRAKVVVGEMIFDEASITAIIPHVMAKHSLRELLSDSDFHYVDSALTILIGEDWQVMQTFKPIVAYITLSMSDALGPDTTNTMDFASAMDIYFQTEAKQTHKKLVGLETAEQQAAILFDSIPEERQADGLLEYLRTREQEDSSAEQLEQNYYNGVVEEDVLADGIEKLERNVLLDDRNQRWLTQLPKLLKQRAFIAVGAGHLGGPMGLVEGLKKMGYTLSPLKLR
jgi:uncharacterized protein YbaP (TraB family)